MKYLNGEYYVEVKDKRFIIQLNENIILRKRDRPESLRNQYQVQNNTQTRKNQKVMKNDNDELIVKNYPRKNKQPVIQQPKFKPPNCPSCKQNNWSEFDKGYYCQNCEYIINKQKHQIDTTFQRQDHYFSNRLPYANKKIRKLLYSVVNTMYSSTEDMIDKLQSVKGRIKSKSYQNINYYNEMNIRRQSGSFHFEEDVFSKSAQGISKTYHEVLLILKILQNRPQFKNLNIKYYDLFYTVIRNQDEKEIVNDEDENKENDRNSFDDFITPNHYIGRKTDDVMLK